MKKNLGKIEKLSNLREIWPNEASDFTNWLALPENLQLLSESVGRNLELVKTEANVGKYNVDILAKDMDRDTHVIIENQLENTNHDHLGKLITYAAGHDVSLAIWIVKKAREEHIQAVKWLNEKTAENIGFFLLEIEVLRINNSEPAPRFDVIVEPNEWLRAVRADAASGEISDTKQKQLNLWTQLNAYIGKNNPQLTCQTPHPQHWHNFAIGSSLGHISLTINSREEYLGCELYIGRDKGFFKFLGERKFLLQEKLGEPCIWISAATASRILIKHPVADVLSQDDATIESYCKWFAEKVILFKRVFFPYCREYANGPQKVTKD